MRVLVVYASKRGGTAGIATTLGTALAGQGLDVEVPAVADAPPTLAGFDAVIVGSALYAMRWQRDAARFVRRHRAELRALPVWCFSSGPLDDSALEGTIAPTRRVEALLGSVGGRGHQTFGGRLASDAGGFVASKMAKSRAGDWRNTAQIEAWAATIGAALRGAPVG